MVLFKHQVTEQKRNHVPPSYWKRATMCQRIWDTWWQTMGIKGKHDFRYGYVSDYNTVSSPAVVMCNPSSISSFSFWHGHNCASLGTSMLYCCKGNPSSHQDSHQMHLTLGISMHDSHIRRLCTIKLVLLGTATLRIPHFCCLGMSASTPLEWTCHLMTSFAKNLPESHDKQE